jgi:hypothetical protein
MVSGDSSTTAHYEISQNLVNDCLILNAAVRRIGESLPRERSERFGYHLGFAPALLANPHVDVA